ncbi:ATP-binding protein [Mycolicibacterium sp.]|uniref:ATP-binding protein n=1 Tax=Mycolicibacterium sp. TaxID=2320850 RepID=UPI00355EB563
MTSRVDPEGARRMMEMLVNLYSDRRLAVVREYVSNAVDTTRVAGSTEPVEVTTPTVLDPNLIVTDHGTGMSTAEVEATFLAFAASTKRDSNELIGGLGIGAKAAWALAESFVVDTVKNGKRTVVRAARDLSHQVILSGVPSEQSDGTTITVPVEIGSHGEYWRHVVSEVASAHAEGAVVVDGAAVPSIAAGPTWIGPVSCKQVNQEHAVMVRSGGTLFASVPEVTQRVLSATKLTACLIELPVGSFDHTPSRETLVATARTLAAVETVLAQYARAYAERAQQVRELAETDLAAAVALRSATLGGVGTAEHLPIAFTVEVPADIGAWSSIVSKSGRKRWERVAAGEDDFTAVAGTREMARTVVVTDVPAGRTLRGFVTFLADEHPAAVRVIPVPKGQASALLPVRDAKNELTGQHWAVGADTAGVRHYTFDQWCEALAQLRVKRGPATGYYCTVVESDNAEPRHAMLAGAEIAALNLPVWFTNGDRPLQPPPSAHACVAVYLGKRLERPLVAAVPHAVSREAWLEQRFHTETATWTGEELLSTAYRLYDQHQTLLCAAAAAAERIDSGSPTPQVLSSASAVVKTAETVTAEQQATLQAVSGCASVRALTSKVSELSYAIQHAYPLTRHLRQWASARDREEFIDYMVNTPPRPLRDGNDAAA